MERISVVKLPVPSAKVKSMALLRVRNEEDILSDTLKYLCNHVDGVLAFNDASTDSTLEILQSSDVVLGILSNNNWLETPDQRISEETLHRQILLEFCRENFDPVWICSVDADERITGDWGRETTAFFLNDTTGRDSLRVRLFDAYLTPADHEPICDNLLNSRTWFGPEYRDILMIWKNLDYIKFEGLDAREPSNYVSSFQRFKCQHFGKAVSLKQFEDTCDYYRGHFPWETYGKKWSMRKGHAIHEKSDFGRDLRKWGPFLFAEAVSL